jgi:hypothetical protein
MSYPGRSPDVLCFRANDIVIYHYAAGEVSRVHSTCSYWYQLQGRHESDLLGEVPFNLIYVELQK